MQAVASKISSIEVPSPFDSSADAHAAGKTCHVSCISIGKKVVPRAVCSDRQTMATRVHVDKM